MTWVKWCDFDGSKEWRSRTQKQLYAIHPFEIGRLPCRFRHSVYQFADHSITVEVDTVCTIPNVPCSLWPRHVSWYSWPTDTDKHPRTDIESNHVDTTRWQTRVICHADTSDRFKNNIRRVSHSIYMYVVKWHSILSQYIYVRREVA